jgi:ribonuclease HI
VRRFLDRATNNEAEYCGLCCGLESAVKELARFKANHLENGGTVNVELIVQGDSQLIIKQLTNEYRCNRPALQVYLAKARKQIGILSKGCTLKAKYEHIYRKFNSVADGKFPLCISRSSCGGQFLTWYVGTSRQV